MALVHPELDEVITQVRRFVREKIVPLEIEIDETDEVPPHVRERAAAMGLFGFALPAEYGGLGLTSEEESVLAFELGWTTPAFRSLFGTNNAIAGQVIAQSGTADQKANYLPRMAAGELVASFALTEPEAGSDAAGVQTTATWNGSQYRIDGTKQFITNASHAGLFVVFARTSEGPRPADGISAFLVEAGTHGISVGPRDRKMGQAGAVSAPVTFHNVVVPRTALLGDLEGQGFKAAMASLNRGRLHVAALCVGMAERLIEESVQYAETRQQFGQPIADFQMIQAMLARSRMQSHAGRALVLEASRRLDAGGRVVELAASAKLFCSEMVNVVADSAVQIHGGMGYMRGTTVERCYRDARLFRIYEGTSEVQLLIIAREMRRTYRDGQAPSQDRRKSHANDE